jgi:hypothetical protein
MYEVCGKILCGDIEDEKDRVAGRFRVYYADFGSAENHGVSAFEVLDTYQHTCEYAEAILLLFDLVGVFSRQMKVLPNCYLNYPP